MLHKDPSNDSPSGYRAPLKLEIAATADAHLPSQLLLSGVAVEKLRFRQNS
jgi:hypothetical protein